MKKLKITITVDHAILQVDGQTNARFPNTEQGINEAKVELFTLAWQLAELGNRIELIPYTN